MGIHMKNWSITLLLFALLGACSDDSPQTMAITNVTVIDAVNGVRENQTVVFGGDEILAVQAAEAAVDAAEQ